MDDLQDPDRESADEQDATTSTERPVDRFRRSATGTVIAAGLLGLRDALEGRPQKDEIAIVDDAPERSPTDELEVVLDSEHPERSVAIVRRPPGAAEPSE